MSDEFKVPQMLSFYTSKGKGTLLLALEAIAEMTRLIEEGNCVCGTSRATYRGHDPKVDEIVDFYEFKIVLATPITPTKGNDIPCES
jgi:hypothetical protein